MSPIWDPQCHDMSLRGLRLPCVYNGETQDRMPPSGLAPLCLSLVDGLVPLIRWDLHDPTTIPALPRAPGAAGSSGIHTAVASESLM